MSRDHDLPDPHNAALLRLGRSAIEHLDLSGLLHEAAAIVAEVLAVDFCKILELLPDGENLLLRAGVGWREGLVGQTLVPASSETHAGHALLIRAPVIVDDLLAEERFPAPSLLHDHGVTSGVSVVIPGAGPFGVLAVHTSGRRSFSAQEVVFLEAVAEILGGAIHRLRTRDALRESEERFRRTFEDSPIGMTIAGLDHRFLRANRVVCDLLGYSEEEFKQLTVDQITHPDDLAKTPESTGKLDRGEVSSFGLEKRLLAKSGETVWVKTTITLIRDEQGNPLHAVGMFEDFTEHRRLDRDLRLGRFTLDQAQEAIGWTSPDGRITDVNEATCFLLGYSRQELLSMSVPDIDPTVSAEAWPEVWQDLKRRGHMARESRLRRKDGREVSVEISVNYLAHNDGQYSCTVARDITERKQASAQLEASEARYRALFENAAAMVSTMDLGGNLTGANKALESFCGYTREELLGKNVADLVPPDQLEIVRSMKERKLREGGTTTYEFDFLTKDGLRRPVQMTSSLIKENGRPVGTQGIAIDISYQQRARETLRRSEEHFRALIENAQDIITILDDGGAVRFVSPSIKWVLGYKPEERVGKSTFELIHPDDLPTVREAFTHAAPGAAAALTCRARHKDGSWRYIDLVARNLLEFPAVAGIVVNARDITERKQAEAELYQSREELRALTARLIGNEEEEHRRLARELHDDLAQRLTAVAFDLAGLEKECPGRIPSSLKKKLHTAHACVVSLSDDVRRLAHQLHPAALELLGLPAALRQICQEAFVPGRLEARFTVRKLPGSFPPDVALCFYRVAQECLRNIAKHTRSDKVSVTLSGGAPGFRLSIKDNGTGFDPTAPRSKGGLGLISIKERVRLVGGTLSIESRPGKGTRVTVEVPVSSPGGAKG
jgi:PAS domain S-box-containing protein